MNFYQYKIEDIDVYDGDTITATLDMGCNKKWHKRKMRLYGLDTPEIRKRGDPLHREAGRMVRDFLQAYLEMNLDKVYVETHRDKSGMYGRLLVTLHSGDGLNINEYMIKSGFAKPTGKSGKRQPWTKNELQAIINNM